MSDELLTSLLRDVSRSFYLTMRALPGPVRRQISLAYLLARTTDTIADAGLADVPSRLRALAALRGKILGPGDAPLPLEPFLSSQATPAEQVLLKRCPESLRLLRDLDPDDRRLVREVLDIIIGGQELDLQRFGSATGSRIVALPTQSELDDYTYRVAGCVGEFWTRMCRAHLFPKAPLDDSFLLANGVRFGKGLQLVNILRDLPSDLRQGRCYLPQDNLAACGLGPADLLQPANEPRLRPLYDALLGRAQAHLLAGWDYTNALPRRSVRVRLACAWPILIGIETVRLLRCGNVLDSSRPLKVSRLEVKRLLWRSVLYYPSAAAWRGLVRRSTDKSQRNVRRLV